MTSALRAEDLVAGYTAEVNILNGLSIAVAEGELVTVVGPNGAGKSTLLKVLMGLLRPRSGKVFLGEADITGARPSIACRQGLAYVPQRENVFETMTILENLEIGLTPNETLSFQDRAQVMFELFPRLAERRSQPAGNLSGGERQMLAMARALMPAPHVLLLDEPTAGLAPRYVDAMFQQVAAINRSGITILMVEQNARAALAMSHRGYVLDLGRNAFEGPGPDLLSNDRVAELYLGGRAEAAPAS